MRAWLNSRTFAWIQPRTHSECKRLFIHSSADAPN